MAATDTAGKAVYLCIFRILRNDGWEAVCVIDGRQYADPDVVHALAAEALKTLGQLRIPAELEKVVPDEGEPPLNLPTWDEFHAGLVDPGEAGR